jgi:hypothetical protein
MNTYYLSLVGPLIGLYLEVKAPSQAIVREWASKQLGPKVWCSVYTKSELENENIQIVGKLVRLEQDALDIAFDYL